MNEVKISSVNNHLPLILGFKVRVPRNYLMVFFQPRLHQLQIILKAKLSRNEVLQYRGKNAISKFKSENPERGGDSLCSILGCCHGVDLECYGCHPGLLAMGIPCDQQLYYGACKGGCQEEQSRDCFCDTSCIIFEDCCNDHFGACAELYDVRMFNQESDYYQLTSIISDTRHLLTAGTLR